MITEALSKIKEWNPDINPKYAMVDYDHAKILSLETVFPDIEVFLCDFHREQAWHRLINKHNNGVSNIADLIKARLRRIANATTLDELKKAISDLMKWEMFQGKFKKWFLGTWYPECKRWCLYYRPKDMIYCNTNNGVERPNRSLKLPGNECDVM